MAIDAAAVYASAIRTPGLLPNAQIVVDHFHLVTWELRDHRIRFHCTSKTADSNPDFKLARSKSKTTYEARRGGTECGAGDS